METRLELFVVLEYRRSPASFLQCLILNPRLAECRQALEEAGHPWEVGDKAKLFVHPEVCRRVINFLGVHGVVLDDGARLFDTDMKRRHVICGEEFQKVTEDAISFLPCREKVTLKRRGRFLLEAPVTADRLRRRGL